MQITGFLGFFSICMQFFPSNADSMCPVEVMNDMFTNVGWLEWEQKEYAYIIDRWMDTADIFYVSYLLTPSMNGRIVTDNNVIHKIRQAHQFLSCKYAKVLQKLFEYEKGLGHACMKNNNSRQLSLCLEELLEMLKKSDKLVRRMKGSLSCLHQLHPLVPFAYDVYEILEEYSNYYENIPFDTDSITTEGDDTVDSTAAKLAKSIEDELLKNLKRLNSFHNTFCRVTLPEGQDGENSIHAWVVQNIIKSSDSLHVTDLLAGDIKRIIRSFKTSFDERFGFKYDKESKKTRLMYDADLLLRVKLMNKLFESSGWPKIISSIIKMPQQNWKTVESVCTAGDDGKIVTKANVDEKTQQAHLCLSCKYALTLKKCCNYAILIWKQYRMNLPESTIETEQFVNAITMSIPLVSSMRVALAHFDRLSPHIKYNRNVFDQLEIFINYFESKVFKENADLPTFLESLKNLDIVINMTNIVKRLVKFYEPRCLIIPGHSEENTVLVKDGEFSNLQYHIAEEVNQLILSNYTEFGFPFDTSQFKKKGDEK